ncbi:MAG: hypothetical protein VKJ24_04175 [Synechococcales bacterium]|nr:hypothetical protein [Synechococcales bacterium]
MILTSQVVQTPPEQENQKSMAIYVAFVGFTVAFISVVFTGFVFPG